MMRALLTGSLVTATILATAQCAARKPTSTSPTPPAEPAAPARPEPILVDVSHRRELRAGWVATVANINWPSKPGLSAEVQQQELIDLLDASAEAGLNAIIFQIRPEADALYASELEPWSRYLTGTQGEGPGYDPLSMAIEAAHDRGMELHGWFNPYRAALDHRNPLAATHVANTLADHVHRYGTHRWMDPGSPEVQAHTAAVVQDVVSRYDIDGVHFDDYFYPYPTRARFPDRSTFEAYGGAMQLSDWRRANVDGMVERVSDVVRSTKPWVRFGISPFGIYRPGIPEGIKGFDQYAKLYADPPRWRAEGWVDYLAPQLYWPIPKTAQSYESLLGWWSSLPGDGWTFPGNFLAKLGSDDRWTVDEFRHQVELDRAHGHGSIWFHIGPLLDNQDGIRDVFRDELYATPALPPPIAAMADVPVDPPVVEVEDNLVSLTHPDARWWVLYAPDGEGWTISRVFPATDEPLGLPDGRYVITAAGRHGVESRGVLLAVPE